MKEYKSSLNKVTDMLKTLDHGYSNVEIKQGSGFIDFTIILYCNIEIKLMAGSSKEYDMVMDAIKYLQDITGYANK
jgi:hypothetical protein